jgi:hypothetical protein
MRSSLVIPAVFLFLLAAPALSEQKRPGNPREDSPFGISMSIGNLAMFGISLDYYPTALWNLEATAGFGWGCGLSIHPFGNDDERHWSPFLGLHGGVAPFPEIDLFEDDDDQPEDYDSQPALFVPLGVHYISDSGFSFEFELGYLHGFADEDSEASAWPFWMGLNLGYRPF